MYVAITVSGPQTKRKSFRIVTTANYLLLRCYFEDNLLRISYAFEIIRFVEETFINITVDGTIAGVGGLVGGASGLSWSDVGILGQTTQNEGGVKIEEENVTTNNGLSWCSPSETHVKISKRIGLGTHILSRRSPWVK
jgi:hypothetical protein